MSDSSPTNRFLYNPSSQEDNVTATQAAKLLLPSSNNRRGL